MTGDAVKRGRSASDEDDTTPSKRGAPCIPADACMGNGPVEQVAVGESADGTYRPLDCQGEEPLMAPADAGEGSSGARKLSPSQKRDLASILLNLCVVIVTAVQSFPQLFGLGSMPGLGFHDLLDEEEEDEEDLQLMRQNLLVSFHHVRMIALGKLALLSEEEGEEEEGEEEGEEEREESESEEEGGEP